MATSRPLTKQERIYSALRERILDGVYNPGYRVVIDSIANEFDVSPLPVREAIRRLEAEGLVIFRPNQGAQVAPVDPGLLEHEMTVLAVLEGYATALAAAEMSDSDLDRLTAINGEMVEAMEVMDSRQFGRLNRQFHQVIYERCPNPSLVDMMNTVNDRLAQIRSTVFIQIPYRGRDSVREHEEIIALLRDGASATKIEKLARAHKLKTVESFRAWQAEH